jgi:hypothetical protein
MGGCHGCLHIFTTSGFAPISFFPDAGVSVLDVTETEKTYLLASGLKGGGFGNAIEAGIGAIDRSAHRSGRRDHSRGDQGIEGVALSDFEAAWLTETQPRTMSSPC